MPDLAGLDVCFLAGTLGQGGAERQLFYVLRALKRAGARPRLLSLTQGEFWEKRIRDLEVPVMYVGQSRSRLARLACIVRVLRRAEPAVLQSQHFYMNVYTALAARILGARDAGALRSDARSEVKTNGRLFGPLSLRLPRALVANSHQAIRNASSMGVAAERLHYLPSVVDTAHFAPGYESRHCGMCVIGVGRLGPEKRFDRFLRTLAVARARAGDSLTGSIVGEGPERPALDAAARHLELLPGAVQFTGAALDTAALYRNADVLLLTSDWEGTPNVVLEAMSSGLPVVATRVGGVADLVDDGETGFLIDVDDENGMAEALVRLSTDSHLRIEMGRRARRKAVSCYSPERLPGLLSTLYDGLLR